MSERDDRVVTFERGRHAFLLENEDDKSGRVVLRPLTRADVSGSDWTRPLVLLRNVLGLKKPDKDIWPRECQPTSAQCEGTGKVSCDCVCEMCDGHEVDCIGCDGCLEPEEASQ